MGMDSGKDRTLGLGKVSQEVMDRSVFPYLPLASEPQLDAGIIASEGELVIAHSPSIGVPLEALGFFGFHYAASNVAARFAKPKHLITGLYLPLGSSERDLAIIAEGLGDEARRYDVTIAAGQTATYAGLEIPLVTATCIGDRIGEPDPPAPGDDVILVGAVGGEAAWLLEMSGGAVGDSWSAFTPLPALLRLQGVGGVKLMHDVSEGGVKKALQEVSESLGLRLEVETGGIHFAHGAKELDEDPLRVPTYGTAVVLAEPGAGDEIDNACQELNVPCSHVGSIEEGAGLFVDSVEVGQLGRVELDWLYGSFKEP